MWPVVVGSKPVKQVNKFSYEKFRNLFMKSTKHFVKKLKSFWKK